MQDEIAAVFVKASVARLQASQQEIARCLGKLNPEQIWSRGADHENSIANLLLHLEGNLRQWILHGIDGQPDVRKRDEEFTLAPLQHVDEVRKRFDDTVAECIKVIGALPPSRLLEKIEPQPARKLGPETITEAIYRVVGHVLMHQGQIILLTKQLCGTDLDFTVPRKR